ncbi:uncharacterized protein LOC111395240 [Olea europaea var. sylvestris]|uniref:uncharacterized protein LOC111395240 n=1 Tax=Olea europaea var. sylvestris TaxID=158386 RepID=UPI000C1D1F58|nr:uncharacterized protein LOC111395240 [Olea europaea var. sylvestris]
MRPVDREAPRKTVEVHNMDAVTEWAVQMEVLTMKMDNLSKSVNMVHQLPYVCEGCGADHATTRCFLASTHVNQPEEVSIKNLEQQVGQIATVIANRPPGTLPSDIEKNPREQVLAVEVVNYATIELPSFTPANPVKAYLPKITVKKKVNEKNQVPTMGEESVEQSREAIDNDQKIVSDSTQFKANVLGTTLTPLLPFPQRLQKTNLEKQAMKFLEVLKKLKLGLGDPKAAFIILQLEDRSLKHPYGIVEDMLIKAKEFIFLADFIILDIDKAYQVQ